MPIKPRLTWTNLARLSLPVVTTTATATATATATTRGPASISISSFRTDFFQRELPVLLPRGYYSELACIRKWFKQKESSSSSSSSSSRTKSKTKRWALDTDYLSLYGDASVEVEATQIGAAGEVVRFARSSRVPLSVFLRWADETQESGSIAAAADVGKTTGSIQADSEDDGDHTEEMKNTAAVATKLYIAQSPLADLPLLLQEDVGLPMLVQQTGKGDVYGSSLWMGFGATNTPLHRDPNPNLFVQLAGRKRLRVMPPLSGGAVYAGSKATNGQYDTSGHIRGEEMMVGSEAQALEQAVWREPMNDNEREYKDTPIYEAVVESGDAIYIPTGWWHAVKGEGDGINASVCPDSQRKLYGELTIFVGQLVVQMKGLTSIA